MLFKISWICPFQSKAFDLFLNKMEGKKKIFQIFLIVLLSSESRCDLSADSEFSVNIDSGATISDFVAPQRVYGFYEVAPSSNTEMVWQSPERTGFGQSVAVLFMAHGCSHAATDFFDKSKDCVNCIGLPVERRLVLAALQKGFFVVAVSSNDRIGSRSDQFLPI